MFAQLTAQGYATTYGFPRRLDSVRVRDGQGLYHAYLYARSKTHGVNVPCLVTPCCVLVNPALADGFSPQDTLELNERLHHALAELSPTLSSGALDTIREDFLRWGYVEFNTKNVHFR